MTTPTKKNIEDIKVSFHPTKKQLSEIEQWLKVEYEKNGAGFYCNWQTISVSFQRKEMTTISLNNQTIGFATWYAHSKKTARIDIVEVKNSCRNKGIGKNLTNQLLAHLKEKGFVAVDLHCAPADSEPIWKHLGFLELPDPPENYKMPFLDYKTLYKILIPYLQNAKEPSQYETLELWNNEPYTISDNTPPTYIWNLEFIQGTRKLVTPIIHPAHYDWKLTWKKNSITKIEGKVKYFPITCDYRNFLIIDELPT